MKRIGNLFQETVSFENFYKASKKAMKKKRMHENVSAFFFNMEKEIFNLKAEIESGKYQPRPYHQFIIKEPKVRLICCSDFRDRVVHHAVCNILDPVFEKKLISDSFACRRGKGTHKGVARCQELSLRYKYFLKCDVRKYFESIDHSILKTLLTSFFKDKAFLELLNIVVDHCVPGYAEGKGLPIGNLTSQYFANIYLGELDHFLKDQLRVPGYIRYMDDFILFSDSKLDLKNKLDQVRKFLSEELALELKEKVVRIAPVTEGIPFLGFRIFPKIIRLQRANLVRFRRKIRRREKEYSLGEIDEQSFLRSVQAMMGHIQHVNTKALRRKEFFGI